MSYLEHPQTIEFDIDKAPEKPNLNQFFQKGNGKEGWRGKMTRKNANFSLYALVSVCTRLSIHSSHRYVCVPAGRIFRLGIYLRSSTCWSMQFVILDCYSTQQKSWAIGWTQLTLLSCVGVSLVISIGWSNWLDDERSPSVCHQVNQSNWFNDKGLISIYHQSIQGSWLDNKGLTDTHLQYTIKLASNSSMAKEWQNIYLSICHWVIKEAGLIMKGKY